MPTVLKVGPYRLYFYSADSSEQPHVHVERDDKTAKFWLQPVRLESGGGFGRVEIRRVQAIVEQNIELLTRSWNEFFSC